MEQNIGSIKVIKVVVRRSFNNIAWTVGRRLIDRWYILQYIAAMQ